MEVSSEYIKNDYLSLKNEGELDPRNPQRLTQFWDCGESFRRHELQTYNAMYAPAPIYYQYAQQNINVQQRKEVPTKILKQQKSPAKKPTFRENELVSSFKRQKLEETPDEFECKPLEPKASPTKVENEVVQEIQESRGSKKHANDDDPQDNKIPPDCIKEDSSKSVTNELGTRPSCDVEEEEKK